MLNSTSTRIVFFFLFFCVCVCVCRFDFLVKRKLKILRQGRNKRPQRPVRILQISKVVIVSTHAKDEIESHPMISISRWNLFLKNGGGGDVMTPFAFAFFSEWMKTRKNSSVWFTQETQRGVHIRVWRRSPAAIIRPLPWPLYMHSSWSVL